MRLLSIYNLIFGLTQQILCSKITEYCNHFIAYGNKMSVSGQFRGGVFKNASTRIIYDVYFIKNLMPSITFKKLKIVNPKKSLICGGVLKNVSTRMTYDILI
jgi:hypothetical protein